jgi:thiamine-monophosphate kinase
MLQPYLAGGAAAMAGVLEVGAGDDGALWRPDPDQSVVVTTDSLVEDVHFRTPTDPTAAVDLGWKVLAVSYSDLAAMGAAPGPTFVSLSLPATWEVEWVEAMYRGMTEAVAAYGGGLGGGNITASATAVLTSTCLGQVDAERVLRRGGAEPGWLLAVTGEVGGAGAAARLAGDRGAIPGLAALAVVTIEGWQRRLRRPEPRLAAAAVAVDRGITSAIDVSDGVFADAGRLLAWGPGAATGVVIDAEAIPVAAGVREAWPRAWLEVAGGGEDYELLLAAPAPAMEDAIAAMAAVGTPAQVIGAFDSGSGVRLREGDQERDTPGGGHQHFG